MIQKKHPRNSLQQAEATDLLRTGEQSTSESPAKLFVVSRLEWSQTPSALRDKPDEGVDGGPIPFILRVVEAIYKTYVYFQKLKRLVSITLVSDAAEVDSQACVTLH